MPIALKRPARIFNVLMHVDMFSAIYTSQGSGDILERMCGCWERIMEDQRWYRRVLKQVKQCVMPIYAYWALTRPARIFQCSNACRHVQWDIH